MRNLLKEMSHSFLTIFPFIKKGLYSPPSKGIISRNIFCGFLLILFFYNHTVFGYTLLRGDWSYYADPMGESMVVYENTSDTTGVLNAILNAMNTWDNAGARFKFTYGGNDAKPVPNYDNINQIRWDQRDGDYFLAQATMWFSSNKLIEADVVFNDRYAWATGSYIPSGSYDVESVALHELGHVLGLDHYYAPAIMQSGIGSGVKRRALDTDDINGILALYGSNGGVACVDADGDGYYPTVECAGSLLDCNDNDASIYPGAPEICNDGKDNDCDGLIDCDDPDCYAQCSAAPDLTCTWVDVKRNRRNRVTASLTVSNTGSGAAQTAFLVNVYLSPDALLDGGDTLIKTYQLAGLGAGASTTYSFRYDMPANSYLIAVVDPPIGVVAESDETNNMAAAPVP